MLASRPLTVADTGLSFCSSDNGFAYTVGPTNGDHWLLYITSPRNPSNSNPASPRNLSSSIATLTPSGSPPQTKEKSKTAAYAASSSVLEDAIASAALHFPQRPDPSRSSSISSSSSSSKDRHQPHDATPSSSLERPLRLPSLGQLGLGKRGDQTLELLMTHLSEKGRRQFYPPPLDDGLEVDGIEGGKVMSCVPSSCPLALRRPSARAHGNAS